MNRRRFLLAGVVIKEVNINEMVYSFLIVFIGRIFTKVVLHFVEFKVASNEILFGLEIGLSLVILTVIVIYLSRSSFKFKKYTKK